MSRSIFRARPVRILTVAAAAALLLGACGGKSKTTSQAPKTVKLSAGASDAADKSIAVLSFLPSSATVVQGASVTWTVPGPEPHTVTFVPAGSKAPLPDDPASTKAFGTPGPYDGTTKVSSGMLAAGPTAPTTFTLSFPKAGTFTYYCHIHANMVGKLTVVSGSNADTQAQIDSRATSERDTYLAEGRAAKQALTSKSPKKKTNSDGSTTWYVEMGASTAHTDILAFAPVPANIKKRDSVVFVNNSTAPHTASFAGKSTLPQDPESKEAMNAAPGKSPQTLNATAFFNTGWLPPNAPPGSVPEAARSFTFKVPTAGTYAYVCLLHAPSGMAGTIVAT